MYVCRLYIESDVFRGGGVKGGNTPLSFSIFESGNKNISTIVMNCNFLEV